MVLSGRHEQRRQPVAHRASCEAIDHGHEIAFSGSQQRKCAEANQPQERIKRDYYGDENLRSIRTEMPLPQLPVQASKYS